MIALVKFSDEPPKKRVSRRRAVRRIECVKTVRFGMRTFELRLGRALANEGFIYDAAAELLREGGFREVVCAEGSPIASELASRGIAPPPPRLAKLCMAEIAVSAHEQLGDCTIGIYARRRSRELERTVKALTVRTRSLALCVDRGAESYARELMYDYGLSVLTSREALAASELKILFDEPDFDIGRGTAVGCARPAVGLMTVETLRYALPDSFLHSEYPPLELASAAAGQGVLRPGDVGISELRFANSIDISAARHYNAIWNPEKDERQVH